jgi:carbon storage regulator
MLVLSRKVGQIVNIGKTIVVKVLGVRGDTVRLGFDAPEEVPIHRNEIFEKIAQEEANENDTG